MKNRFYLCCALAILVNNLVLCHSPNQPAKIRLNVKTSRTLGKMIHHYGSVNDSIAKHGYERLQNWLQSKKATLVPTFPGIKDEELQTYFQLKSTTPITPQHVKQFLKLPGIEAGYEKPIEEVPR